MKKHLLRSLFAVSLVFLFIASSATTAVYGIRRYDASVCGFDDFSAVVDTFADSETEKMLIVKTDGTRPDFRTVPAEYTVEGPDDTYVVGFDSPEEAKAMIPTIEKMRGVEYAEPNVLVCAQSDVPIEIPDASWGIPYMHMDEFSNELLSGELESTVTVAVVDSGIIDTHPLFDGRIQDGHSMIDGEDYNTDGYGHGTAVAGVIADCTKNLPVRLFIVKVLDNDGFATVLDAANGMKYAADQGVDVINLSFVSTTCTETMHDAIDYICQSGAVPVVSAGNYGYNMERRDCCPSHMKEPIVVSGINKDGSFYQNSCYGPTIDVAAPASGVLCASRSGNYVALNGTSFSAPHIAALLAMYKLYQPSATPAKLEEMLKSHAMDYGAKGFDNQFGWGVPMAGEFRLSDISLKEKPTKTEFYYKESITLQGFSLVRKYEDGHEEKVDSGITIKSPDKIRRGENTYYICYAGYEIPIVVTVRLRWWQWLIWIPLFGFLWY